MSEAIKIICQNKKAAYNYNLIEKFEAGISLKGSEVKSLRDGRANLVDSYARVSNGEIFLVNSHISSYTHAPADNHEPTRSRKLLMHKREIHRLTGKVQEKGLTLIPTKLYFRKGKVKVELAIAKGKKIFDKRQSIKEKELKRELERTVKQRVRI